MNIDSSTINQTTQTATKTTTNITSNNSEIKFSDELKELENTSKQKTNEEQDIKVQESKTQNLETENPEIKNIKIQNNDLNSDTSKEISQIDISKSLEDLTNIVSQFTQPDEKSEFIQSDEKPQFNQLDKNSEFIQPDEKSQFSQLDKNSEFIQPDEKPQFNQLDKNSEFIQQDKKPQFSQIEKLEESEKLEKNEDLIKIMPKLNQSDEISDFSLKKESKLDDNTDNTEKGEDLINNDFNIRENKDILPQMSLNMGFSGDGQPFSSFMNNENEKSKETLKSSAADLKEEAAILSTMEENIAIANRNQSAVTIETVVKYDSVIMNETDVQVFATLVENGEVNLKELPTDTAKNSVHVSKTLADMLAKSMENNQPLRIDFDNGISIIIKVSREGKISADFLPSTQIAEAYLKENLPILKQRFDEKNLEYDELNQRNKKEQSKEDNRKKGRRDE